MQIESFLYIHSILFQFQIEAEVAVGDVQKITLSFKNPLQQMLTGGHFNLSVPRVLARTIPIYVGNIAPRGSVVGHFDLQIRVSNKRGELVVH